MKRWKTTLAVLAGATLVAAGCSTSSAPANSNNASPSKSSDTATAGKDTGKKIEIKLSHHLAENSGFQQAFQKFAEVAMKDDPELDIKIYPNSQLGTEKDAIGQVKAGTLQMALGDMANFATYDKKLPVIDLPFMFSTYDEFHKTVDGDVGKELSKELLDKTGIKTLAYMDGGIRDIYSTKPINSPNDLKGLKIRVPEASIYVDTFKGLGANPTSVPASQMYTSLQTGVVDAMEGTAETAYTFKIGEVAKYAYQTHHINQDAILIINDKFFKGLPQKAQDAILDGAKQAEKFQRDSWQKVEGDFAEKLKAMGVKYTPADIETLKKEEESVYDKFTKDNNAGDLIKEINEKKK